MFDYSLLHWAAFFTAAFLLTLSPGPDIAFILGQTVKGGRKSGFAAMFGIWGGTIGHIIMAVVGLSAILSASATAFAMVKWVGVAYLIWIGRTQVQRRFFHFRNGASRHVIKPYIPAGCSYSTSQSQGCHFLSCVSATICRA